jgi:HPt (histidine-containing phosphotransfer) domain-containing protein
MDIGMNAYLTKPLRIEEVHAVLARFAGSGYGQPGKIPAPEKTAPAPGGTQKHGPDACSQNRVERILTALASQYDLDRDESMPLVQSLFESLTEHRTKVMQNLEDPEATGRHAHTIKGLLLNMGLTPEGLLAKGVEETARTGGDSGSLRESAQVLLDVTADILAELAVALNEEQEAS